MLSNLKTVILKIQEIDMKLMRLKQLKEERQQEWKKFQDDTSLLKKKAESKEGEILGIKKMIRLIEGEHQDILDKIKKLEAQQHSIKKIDEYNAITQEVSMADRERLAREQRLSDLYDKLAAEEEILKGIHVTISEKEGVAARAEEEIVQNIEQINAEGRELQAQRHQLSREADPEILKIYERLLRSKRDRVVVALEKRCCSGCHVMLTAQHENLVRKGERLVFCEHCSRIHYWEEGAVTEGAGPGRTTRRRRSTAGKE